MRRLVCLRRAARGAGDPRHAQPHAAVRAMPGWLHWLFQHGGAGVDVFFILSGLVIVLVTRQLRLSRLAVPDRTRGADLSGVPGGVRPRGGSAAAAAPGSSRWPGSVPTARRAPSGRAVAEGLGGVHRHAHDDDARAVSQRRAAQRLGGVPRRGVEPVDRVAVLPAGVADWRAVGVEADGVAVPGHVGSVDRLACKVPEAWQFSRAFLPNKAQYFALGVVSASVVRDGPKGLPAYLAALAATLALCAVQGGIDKLFRRPVDGLSSGPGLLTVVIPAKAGIQRAWSPASARTMTEGSPPLLQSRPMVWLGAVSYCIYPVLCSNGHQNEFVTSPALGTPT